MLQYLLIRIVKSHMQLILAFREDITFLELHAEEMGHTNSCSRGRTLFILIVGLAGTG